MFPYSAFPSKSPFFPNFQPVLQTQTTETCCLHFPLHYNKQINQEQSGTSNVRTLTYSSYENCLVSTISSNPLSLPPGKKSQQQTTWHLHKIEDAYESTPIMTSKGRNFYQYSALLLAQSFPYRGQGGLSRYWSTKCQPQQPQVLPGLHSRASHLKEVIFSLKNVNFCYSAEENQMLYPWLTR